MRLINAHNIENFAHEESFGTGDMIENWIGETDIPADIRFEYEEELRDLCWSVLRGCMNIIKTEPTVSTYDVDAVIDQITKATGDDGLVFYLNGKPVIHKEQAIEIIRSGGRQQDEQDEN